MLTVYRVNVYFRGSQKVDNHPWIEKEVVKCRVVKTGKGFLYLSQLPDGHWQDKVSGLRKVPVRECYSTLEEAQKHTDEKANELIGKLVGYVDKLKEPAKVLDRLSESVI